MFLSDLIHHFLLKYLETQEMVLKIYFFNLDTQYFLQVLSHSGTVSLSFFGQGAIHAVTRAAKDCFQVPRV